MRFYCNLQGKDLIAGGRSVGHKHRSEAKSDNVYINLLVKVRISREALPSPAPGPVALHAAASRCHCVCFSLLHPIA